MRIVSVLRRAWYLQDISVHRPIVHIFVDEHGRSNLPTIKSSNSNSNTSVFDLGIRHALLDQGEVYYNDRPSALSADLHNLDFHSVFSESEKKYSGQLSYSDGQFVYGAFSPLAHNFTAEFEATPTTFQLTKSQLSVGSSHVNLAASLNNYSSPVVQAQYALSLDGAELAKTLHQSALPSGIIETSGTASYQQLPNKALLNCLEVHGEIGSRTLDVNMPSARGRIQNVAGHYVLSGGNATLSDLRADLLGGSVAAQGTMMNIAGDSHTSVKATVHGVSLAEVVRTAGASAQQLNVAITGRLNAETTAAWGKTLDNLVAHADATIDSDVASRGAAPVTAANANPAPAASGPQTVPLNSALHVTYTAKNAQITVENSYLRTPQTNLTLNGTVSQRSQLALQLQAQDLREVETIADLFTPQKPGQPATQLGLAGAATFHGVVQGSMKVPHLTGQLTATNLAVEGANVKSIRTNVDVSPSFASLQNAEIEPASRGHITLSASTALSQWSFTNTSQIQARINASQLDIAELMKIARQQAPVTGTLNAGLTLHGTELNPVGNGNVSLTNLVAYQQPVSSLNLTFNGDGQQVQGNLSCVRPRAISPATPRCNRMRRPTPQRSKRPELNWTNWKR